MIAAATALGAGALTDAVRAEPARQSRSANDRLGVAIVGVRGRGQSHINAFAGRQDTHVLYLCDPDEQIGRQRAAALAKQQDHQAQWVPDMRTVLEDPSVDVVSIATPHHWHALAAIWAMQAGKDVYVEKPVSHNFNEGRRMVQVARKYQRVCQYGCNIRSMKATRDAMKYLQEGQLGKVLVGRAINYGPRSPIGPKGRYDVPAHINYDLWLGPAPQAPLTRRRFHYDWHWQWPYGNGDLGNVGVHRIDIVRWGMALNRMCKNVFCYGERFRYNDAGQTPNTLVAVYDFGDQVIVSEDRNLRTGERYKNARIALFEATEGYLVMNEYFRGVAFDKDATPLAKFEGAHEDHFDNFLTAVRSRDVKDLRADILDGHLSSGLCHLATVSYQLGELVSGNEAQERLAGMKSGDNLVDTFERTRLHLKDNKVDLNRTKLRLGPSLDFDPANELFINHSQANTLLTRDYRRPFVVPNADQI